MITITSPPRLALVGANGGALNPTDKDKYYQWVVCKPSASGTQQFDVSHFDQVTSGLPNNTVCHLTLDGTISDIVSENYSGDLGKIPSPYKTSRILVGSGEQFIGTYTYKNGWAYDYSYHYTMVWRTELQPDQSIKFFCGRIIDHEDRAYGRYSRKFRFDFAQAMLVTFEGASAYRRTYNGTFSTSNVGNVDTLYAQIDTFFSEGRSFNYSKTSLSQCYRVTPPMTLSRNRLPDITSYTKFEEHRLVRGYPLQRNEFLYHKLKQNAFYAAIEGVNTLSNNMIQNIIEWGSAIRDLFHGRIRIPVNAADGWLTYRYVYTTTKLDMEQMRNYLDNLNVMNYPDTFVYHGVYSENGVTCRCAVTLRNKAVYNLKAFYHWLYNFGLQPNGYVLWDFCPFSFIIDWFLPVGDSWEVNTRYENILDTYECVSCVYSLKYSQDYQTRGMQFSMAAYTRWVEDSFPPVDCNFIVNDGSVSTRTFAYRCLDTASLIFGMRRR